ALAGDRTGLLLRHRAAHTRRRRADFIRRRQTGVVAIEAAQGVVRAEEVVLREAAVVTEFHGVVLPHRFRCGKRRSAAGDRRDLAEAATGVADHVDLVALRVERAE